MLFVLSLIGCLAPLTFIACAIVVPPRREQLAKGGPFYLVLGYTALILSANFRIAAREKYGLTLLANDCS